MRDKKYDALLVDTSIYKENGFKFESNLLKRLEQFSKKSISLLMPDVIYHELTLHLENKIKEARLALEKSLSIAGDHLFFEGSELNNAKETLIDSQEVEGLAASRLQSFIVRTGALRLECGDYLSVSTLVNQYFTNQPPFAQTGKKKSEFPDAIVLMAVEEWAKSKNKKVLAISKDKDWQRYCETSSRVVYEENLSSALDLFNQEAHLDDLLGELEQSLNNNSAQDFLLQVQGGLTRAINDFMLDQHADSDYLWDALGCRTWLYDFHLENKFRVVDKNDSSVVLEAIASITIEAEGEFSLAYYDSIDRESLPMGIISASCTKEFISEILITITNNLNASIGEITVEDVEIVSPINSLDFGTLEPNDVHDWCD